jgi:hypothetical protein
MERLPPLGSSEWLESCKQADKNLGTEPITSYRKLGKAATKPCTRSFVYPDGLVARAVEIYLTQHCSLQKAASMAGMEFKTYLPRSAVFTAVAKDRQEKADAKPQN